MPLLLTDIMTKAEDTLAEWTTPAVCTIKTENIKAEFQKTDVFMTVAVAIKEDKVPTVVFMITAADTKAG